MSRDNDITALASRSAAASAGTTNNYIPVGDRPFIWTGFAWLYESTEANTDNTFDWAIAYTVDGTNFTTLYANANANGLLDSGGPLLELYNKADAASGGGAAIAVTPTAVTIPANAVIRHQHVTAGTGTVPATQIVSIGKYV